MNKKQNKGITLVALVITIIVLIILAAVSINAIMNQGIIDNAKNAKDTYEDAEKKEIEELLKAEGMLDQFVEGTIANKAQKGELKVGEYIEYKYNETTYTTPTGSKGVHSTTQSFDSANANKIERWRVLSTDDGVITIIADDELPSLTLYGDKAYLNGETVLNEMCKTLYSGKYGEARSINLRDINKATGATGRVNYYYENPKAEPYNGIYNRMSIGKEIITIGQLEEQEKNGDLTGLKELKSDVILGANRLSDLKINAIGYTPYELGVTNWKGELGWNMLSKTSDSEDANLNYWVAYKNLHPEYYSESDTSNDSLVTYRMLHFRDNILGSRSLWSSSNEKNATYEARTGIGVRPVVRLISGLMIDGGDGKINSPWTIKEI